MRDARTDPDGPVLPGSCATRALRRRADHRSGRLGAGPAAGPVADPVTGTAVDLLPVATPPLVRAVVAEALVKRPEARVVALAAAPRWHYPPQLEVAGRTVTVVPCGSSLAVRQALVEHPAPAVLAVLTDRADADLGAGLLAHLAGGRMLPLDRWLAVRGRFGAARHDPRLGEWAAAALLEAEPADGWAPVASGFLDRDTALGALSAALLDLDPADLDESGLLQWSLRAQSGAHWAALAPEVKAGLAAWLTERAGPVAGLVAAGCDAGHPGDLVPLGLLAELAAGPDPESAGVRGRLERFVGGVTIEPVLARRWGAASAGLVQRGLQAGVGRELLGRAEALASSLGADPLAGASMLLPRGLDTRLRELATALDEALRNPAAGAGAETALQRVQEHALASIGEQRVLAAEMAVRLLRWTAQAATRPDTLDGLARAQLDDRAWVDRARGAVWGTETDPQVATVYGRLLDRVQAAREADDLAFAARLAVATRAGDVGRTLVVEQVLDRVVVPLVRQQPVLVVLLDGMSGAVAVELAEDLQRRGWVEHVRTGTTRTPVLAALPTVTHVSRTSLFAGRLADGSAADEQRTFPAHPGLLGVSGDRPPALFHKAGLEGGEGWALAEDLAAAVARNGPRLVAVVLNAVDDELSSGDPGRRRWGVDDVRHLAPLSVAAREAGRLLLLLSDHGHVVERASELRRSSGKPARWRPADDPPEPDEVLLEGPRVVRPDGRLVAAATDRLRYAARKAGYHGGATPAEVVIPLLLFAPTLGVELGGWQDAAPQQPSWWLSAARPAAAAPPAATPRAQPTLFESEVHPAAGPELVSQLLTSSTLATQRSRAPRARVEDSRLQAVVQVLLDRGGSAVPAQVAQAAQLPLSRLPGLLSALVKLLNVEGYPVLEHDDDSVRLDERLLRRQFGL